MDPLILSDDFNKQTSGNSKYIHTLDDTGLNFPKYKFQEISGTYG